MSSQLFRIEEHVIPGQHLRGYHNALRSHQEDVLQIVVKAYWPLQAIELPEGRNAVTIIAAHANGFPKEIYEPVWDDLLVAMRACGHDIASVWFAESASQGESGVLNESKLGDDASYFDHSRDLLAMVNHFRQHMTRPIIGIAHSMGCAQLVHLAIMHPRLFAGLALIEPVIQRVNAAGPNAAMMAVIRPDLWKTREEAEAPIRKAHVFRSWDRRVLDRYLANAFRSTPTRLYPVEKAAPGSLTLKTTKHHEAWTYTRTTFEPLSKAIRQVDRWIEPDLDNAAVDDRMFFRQELTIALNELPNLRPPVMWLFGGKSIMSPQQWIDEKLNSTGTGLGGSGGLKAGKVEHVVYPDGNHFVVCEKPKVISQDIADWLRLKALPDYKKENSFWASYGSNKSKNDFLQVSDRFANESKKPVNDAKRAKI